MVAFLNQNQIWGWENLEPDTTTCGWVTNRLYNALVLARLQKVERGMDIIVIVKSTQHTVDGKLKSQTIRLGELSAQGRLV